MYENLKYISQLMDKAVCDGAFSGGNVAVIHKGQTVYSECFGMADKEKGIKMSEDTIFRLFSLSKPVTAAAAMLLLERGEVELRYPVKWFLPTFENPTVLDEKGERPAERDITLGDLLTMTSGIPYPDGTPAGMKMGELWGVRHIITSTAASFMPPVILPLKWASVRWRSHRAKGGCTALPPMLWER